MVKARKEPTERSESSGKSNTKLAEGSSEYYVSGKGKRGRGRPKGKTGPGRKPKKHVEPVRKMVDGKLMKRAVGVPKKVKTGKRGRPRKEYIWVEAN